MPSLMIRPRVPRTVETRRNQYTIPTSADHFIHQILKLGYCSISTWPPGSLMFLSLNYQPVVNRVKAQTLWKDIDKVLRFDLTQVQAPLCQQLPTRQTEP